MADESAGNSPVGWRGIGSLGAVLIALIIFTVYSIVAIWPREIPSAASNKRDSVAGATGTTGTTGTTATTNAPTTTGATGTSGTSATTATTGTTATTETTATSGTSTTDTSATESSDTAEGSLFDLSADECKACEARLDERPDPKSQTPRQLGADCVEAFNSCWLLWPERRLLLLVLLAGMLGSLLHGLRSLAWYTGQRELVLSWTLYYLVLPFTGPALSFVLYMVIRGGFFGSGSTVYDANTFAFVALGALAGMFSEEAIKKLKNIAGSLFEKPEKGKDAASAGPLIASIAPSPLPAGTTKIVITGANFDAASKVFADGVALTTTYKSATILEADVPAAQQKPGGTLAITVQSGTGVASPATKLPMS